MQIHEMTYSYHNGRWWVSIDDMIKELENIMYRLKHDEVIVCWEELAEELIGRLKKVSNSK